MSLSRVVAVAVTAFAVCFAATACTSSARQSTVPPSAPSYVPLGAPLKPRAIAVLGDSISLGQNACGHVSPCLKESWATGTDPAVGSLLERFKRAGDPDVKSVNAAHAGKGVSNLPRQLLVAAKVRPDLVVVLIGANDVCKYRADLVATTESFASHYEAALTSIVHASPKTTVFLTSVPDVVALVDRFGGDPDATGRWAQAHSCDSVLANPTSTAAADVARRATIRNRIESFNSAIQRMCAAVAQCLYDGGALFRYKPQPAQVSSVDYFHPSIAGQEAIAELEWRALGRAAVAARSARK